MHIRAYLICILMRGGGRDIAEHPRTSPKNVFLCFCVDKYKIYVELVSRVKPDVLYRLGAKSYSSITMRGRQYSFVQAGLHFIVLNPKTGKCYFSHSQIMVLFNTLRLYFTFYIPIALLNSDAL